MTLETVEVEAALLGALITDNTIVDVINPILCEDHFSEPMHGRIYAKTRELIDAGKTASPVTLRAYFKDDEAMQELGGAGYLIKICADSAGLIGAKSFADQIIEISIRRSMTNIAATITEMANDTSETTSPNEIMDEAQELLFNISMGATDETIKKQNAGDAAIEAIEQAQKERDGDGSFRVQLPSLKCWNEALGGMAGGALTIVAGRPAMGKSLLGLKIASSCALEGHAVEFINLEMRNTDLGIRLLSDIAYVDKGDGILADHIKHANLKEFEQGRIKTISNRLQKTPFELVQASAMSIGQLSSTLRQSKRKWLSRGHNLRVVVVDYLQLLHATGFRNNKVAETSAISRGLKQMAMELDIHIIALSQLSRAVEQRDDKRPMLSDLRESGSIEQDADNVVFTYREHYYLENAEPKGSDDEWHGWKADLSACENNLDLLVRKVRGGASKTITAHINLPYQAIRDQGFNQKREYQ